MILDKPTISSASPVTPIDQPPAYDVVAETSNATSSSLYTVPSSSSSSYSYFPNDSKNRTSSLDIDNRPITPVTVVARPPPSPSSQSSPTPPPKAPASWIGHLVGTKQSKQDLEVRQTVLGLVSTNDKRNPRGRTPCSRPVFGSFEASFTKAKVRTRQLSTSFNAASQHAEREAYHSRRSRRSGAFKGIHRYIGALSRSVRMLPQAQLQALLGPEAHR